MSRRGEAEIITAIFVVIVAVIAVSFFFDYGKNMLKMDYETSSRLDAYESTTYVKKKLFECYGEPLVINENHNCSIPHSEGSSLVKGYEIDQVRYGYCPNKTWVDEKPEKYDDVIKYPVPIRTGETNCLGNIKVYI